MQIDNLFLGVGAMKAGTTWMYQLLSRHPEIYFTPEKEIHYFAHVYVPDEKPLTEKFRLTRAKAHAAINPDRNRAAGTRARLLWAANYLAEPIDDRWYERLFAFRGRRTWCADFSNLYAHIGPEGWTRIRDGVGRLRVIYTMRDPVRRLWSHMKFHMQYVGKTHEIATATPDWTRDFLHKPFMWKHAEYGEVVRGLRAALGPQELRLFLFDDVATDPFGFLRQVEDLLGLEPFTYPPELVHKRVNESIDAPMPAWFPELLRPDVERIVQELADEGLEPPAAWLSHFEPTKVRA